MLIVLFRLKIRMNMGIFKMLDVYISMSIVLLMCVLLYWLFCDSKADMVFLMAIVIYWPFYVIKFALRFVTKVLNRFIDDMIHL